MVVVRKSLALVTGVSLAVLAGATPARAQIGLPIGGNPFHMVAPGLTLNQAAYNIATLGRAYGFVPPAAYGFNPYTPNALVAPGAGLGGYGGYPYPYHVEGPGTVLRGAADAISAHGRYLVAQQQARLLAQQARGERLANNRKAFDHYLYVRDNTPTPAQLRAEARDRAVARARSNPPVAEILSGRSLNDLLADLQDLNNRGLLTTFKGEPIPLEEEVLRRINLTSRANTGNLALLRNEGRLIWPMALTEDEYQMERERVSTLVAEAVKQAEFNDRVDPNTLRQLREDVDLLSRMLTRNVGELDPGRYIEARRFLTNLEDALRGLRQPGAGNYFRGKMAPQAKTARELVNYMTRNGLTFAPAVPGDEGAYTALHQALAQLSREASSRVAQGK